MVHLYNSDSTESFEGYFVQFFFYYTLYFINLTSLICIL